MASGPQSTRKLLAGPALSSVKFSNLSLKSQQENRKSWAFTSEPMWQGVNHVKLSSVSLPEPGKSVELPLKSILQTMKSGNLMPQTIDPVTKSTKDHPRPHRQDLVKPMELTPRADIQVTSAEVVFEQTSPLKEPKVLTCEQRLQSGKSLSLKTESPKVMKTEDSSQGSVCQNKDSEMITSAKLQAEDYLSRLIHSPSIPFLSSVDKTTELEPLQGSGVPQVSRAFGMKNLGVGILQSSKSYTDTIMIKSSFLPLVLENRPSDKTGDTKGTPYPEIWSMNILSKEESGKEKMEEFQRYSSYSFRLQSEEFQAGLGARRSSIESQHSLKTSSLSQSKNDISEQLQLLKELQLKIAGKFLRSQIPHNVPPPLASGLVLKYPICLQCGRYSGFNCRHKLQSALEPYLLIYPQLHLLSTPEGHGEIRLHLGFRLQTRKRPQVSKYERNRADPWKSAASPSRWKARFSTLASRSPSPRRDFQSRSSLSPASVQGHTQQKNWHSPFGVAGKTTAKDYEFCQVHSLSESDYESNQDEKWVESSLRKTFAPVKTIAKGPKTQSPRLYRISTSTKSSHPRTLRGLPRSRIQTTQTSTVPSRRQPKKFSQPKFIQLLFHSLRRAFQAAHRIVTVTRQKLEYKMRPDNLWSVKNLYPKQRTKDYCLMGDSKGARTPVVGHRSTFSIPKQKEKLCMSTVLERKGFNGEIFSLESKNCSKVGAKFQAQERIVSNPPLKGILQSHVGKKAIHKEEQGFFRERTLCNKPFESTHRRLPQRTHWRSLSKRRHHSPSWRRHSSPSDRTFISLSERSHSSPSQRNSLSSSLRTYHSLSEGSHNSLFKRRGH
ncbi:uncharacterized protein C2orf16-like, partial [Grammomys surdaster]|uniref:uncharacterized protein C2orf16-like n=1 Tax=Grammomys surdaster TaxID=491861 RepID=UPI00109EF149